MICDPFKKQVTLPIAKILVACFLIVVLAACGTNSVVTPSSGQPTPGSTSTKSVSTPTPLSSNLNTPPGLNLNVSSIHVQIGDLLVQSSGGFQCPSIPGKGAVPGQLVFASDPTTYSQSEITQTQAYVNSNFLTSPPPAPPSTLRWLLGGSTALIAGKPGSSSCGAVVTLTNTGNTPIQIPKVGVQLKSRPQQNGYQYRLINVCSLWPPSKTGIGSCPPTAGGGGVCNYYNAPIQLGMGEENSVFSTEPFASNGRGGPPCRILTLAPAAQDELTITFSIAPNTPENLLYSIEPVFTIDTNQGEQTPVLSQLSSTLAFASTSQFSCYELQGTTFALLKSPASEPVWCI